MNSGSEILIRSNLNDEEGNGLVNKRSHIRKLLAVLDGNLSQTNQLHHSFLEGQNQVFNLLLSGTGRMDAPTESNSGGPDVISKAQLVEFGTGSIEKCFGPDFAILDRRKSPRIPNGDLLMVDRVLSITGGRANLKPPASIISEYTISRNIWFLNENPYSGVPLSILVEIALQPCGILSAFIGTSLLIPSETNIFRNLDGKITFTSCPDLAGKTVINKAQLLDSFTSGGMHIQKYAFELSTNGSIFLSGDSSFGYFTQKAMESQTGLDHQTATASILIEETLPEKNYQEKHQPIPIKTITQGQRHLHLLDRLRFIDNVGRYSNGVIIGEKDLNSKEWFYENHFKDDPVMPGSLGLEAVMQGMWSYIQFRQVGADFIHPDIDFSNKEAFTWKYRGQVIPVNQCIRFELHIKAVRTERRYVHLSGDADFWVDGLKIYSFNNLSLTVRER